MEHTLLKTERLGRPQWDLMLHDLIADTYLVAPELMTEDDKAIQTVLICLHEAIQGKTNLQELSERCIAHNERTEVVKRATRVGLWLPK